MRAVVVCKLLFKCHSSHIHLSWAPTVFGSLFIYGVLSTVAIDSFFFFCCDDNNLFLPSFQIQRKLAQTTETL